MLVTIVQAENTFTVLAKWVAVMPHLVDTLEYKLF